MDSLVEEFIEHDSVMEMESQSIDGKEHRVSKMPHLDDQLISFDQSLARTQDNRAPENYESVFAESRATTELTQRSIRVSTFGDDPFIDTERAPISNYGPEIIKSEAYKAPAHRPQQ